MTKAEETSGSSVYASWQYAFDGAGNRTQQIRTGTTGVTAGTTDYTYNAANQLISSTGDINTWTYDGVGNQTRNGRTGVTSAYNDRGQVTLTNGVGYSAYGVGNAEPLGRTNGNVTYRSSPLGLASEKSATANSTTAYTRLPDGEIVGSRTGSARSYFVLDNQKSVVAVYNGLTQASPTARYGYSPYGELRSTPTGAAATNPIRYISGYFDAPSGLYKLGARFYDATLGQFTQFDPSGQEANPYAYAEGNPINKSDPSGLVSSRTVNAFLELFEAFETASTINDYLDALTDPDFIAALTGVLYGAAATSVCIAGLSIIFGPVGFIAQGVCAGLGALVAEFATNQFS